MEKFAPGDLVKLTYNCKRLALVLRFSHTSWGNLTGTGAKVYRVYNFGSKTHELYKEWAMEKVS